MSNHSVQDLGFARVDLQRLRRRGFPEVIYARGKTIQQIVAVAEVLLQNGHPIVVTKLTPGLYRALHRKIPWLTYFPKARMAMGTTQKGAPSLRKVPGRADPFGFVLVVTAGTSDIPVAEEAAVTLELMGVKIRRLFDVGVAGLHRLLRHRPLLSRAKAIVVVAGMDGALPSVVSGLVSCPVVAVPTSVGYGASFKGVAPLLTMLNSCSPGVAVVNIDNGFGAGYLAGIIAQRR